VNYSVRRASYKMAKLNDILVTENFDTLILHPISLHSAKRLHFGKCGSFKKILNPIPEKGITFA